MKFSRNWIGDYVELPESPESVEQLAAILTSIGFQAEGIEPAGDDVLLELEINPNRPDCMNHIGLAREVAAATGKTLRLPGAGGSAGAAEPSRAEGASVVVEDAVGCPRYAAVIVRGVTVGPSPGWLAARLEAVGVRPINNIVDVTNYVLWEYGQPQHAFDLAKLGDEPQIVVRRARRSERLVTLDGEERSLDGAILVIADREKPIALAGIMGGRDTEVGGATTDVLIESAHFDPARVRRGAKQLAMHTDASHRFERGSDVETCLASAWRAAALMAEIAGGDVAATAIDARSAVVEMPSGRLDLAALEAFAGIEIPASIVTSTFPALGFELEEIGEAGASEWRVRIPSWRRFDLEVNATGEVYPAHFYEEALRFFGYENVPASLPAVEGPDAGTDSRYMFRRAVRRYLAATGLAETVTYAFYDATADRRFAGLAADGEPATLTNALSEQYALMRRSLLPGLVAGAEYNQRRGVEVTRLFELGHLFPGAQSAAEVGALGIVLGGSATHPWQGELDLDLFDLKGTLEELSLEFGCEAAFRPADVTGLVSGTGSELLIGDRSIGYLGQVDDPDLLYPLFAAELRLDGFAGGSRLQVKPPSRFPGVSVDLTLTHSIATAWSEIERVIEDRAPEALVDFGLKDRYQGEGVPAGAVNTTIFFSYNADDRSLTQEEVNQQQQGLTRVLEQHFAGSN